MATGSAAADSAPCLQPAAAAAADGSSEASSKIGSKLAPFVLTPARFRTRWFGWMDMEDLWSIKRMQAPRHPRSHKCPPPFRALDLLDLRPDKKEVLYDLGCGDGSLLIEAAKIYGRKHIKS